MRPRVYGAVVTAAIALPIIALLFVLAGVSEKAVALVLPVATAPLLAIIVAGNRAYFGSGGVVRPSRLRRRTTAASEPGTREDELDELEELDEYEDWEDPEDPLFPANGQDR